MIRLSLRRRLLTLIANNTKIRKIRADLKKNLRNKVILSFKINMLLLNKEKN